MAGWSVTEMTGTLTRLKEELPKQLRFPYSCCKIRRNHRRVRMVTLGHVRLWHRPQQMPREEHGNRASTIKPSCPSYHPPSLSPPPAQGIASSGLPREDKAEIVSPTDVVLWLAAHLCYVWRTQSCLSHPCRGSPGIGSSLFSTQNPSWLKETSPEGFKALCNYQDSAEAHFLGIQDLYWKYPKSSRVLAPSTAHYSFSGIYSCISQHRTRIFLSVTDRYCSALSEQL